MTIKTPIGDISNEAKLTDFPDEFYSWWKIHPHAGYEEDPNNGYAFWGISPRRAWACDRYRTEYAQERSQSYLNGFLVSRDNPTGDVRNAPRTVKEWRERGATPTAIKNHLNGQGGPFPAQETA